MGKSARFFPPFSYHFTAGNARRQAESGRLQGELGRKICGRPAISIETAPPINAENTAVHRETGCARPALEEKPSFAKVHGYMLARRHGDEDDFSCAMKGKRREHSSAMKRKCAGQGDKNALQR